MKRIATWKMLVMLLTFVSVDLILLLTFGMLFLNGMEFTSLKILSPDTAPAFFSWKDYFRNCTAWCLTEDVLIVLLYALHRRLHPEQTEQHTEIVYFWLVHISVKIFLNIHSTAMFLSALEYARVSGWTVFLLGETDFFVPADCFAAQRNSLLLSLSVLLLTFALLIGHISWRKRPVLYTALLAADVYMFPLWSDRLTAGQKLLILLVLAALPAAVHFFPDALPALLQKHHPKQVDRIDLYQKYSRPFSFAFLLFSIIWWIVRTWVFPTDNKNSFLGMQYSAILKFLTPLFLLANLMLSRTERSEPRKYIQHSANLYIYHTLLLIGSGCLALAIFGEFGSIVCVLSLTMAMFLLLVDFVNLQQDSAVSGAATALRLIRTGVLSILVGLLTGLAFTAAENSLFQLILRHFHLELGGTLGTVSLSTSLCIGLGIVSVLLIVLTIAVGIFSILLPSPELLVRVVKRTAANLLNLLEKLFGKLTIHHLHKKPHGAKQVAHAQKGSISVCIVLLLSVGMMYYYNFHFAGYSGTTVLKSFYMKAGNFSNEFEITENITQKRAEEVRQANRLEQAETPPATEAPVLPESVMQQLEQTAAEKRPGEAVASVSYVTDPVPTIEELSRYYITGVYTGHTLKLMQLIDRLCYSSRTAELSAVQKGLKRNMGFAVSECKQHNTYISSLQKKHFLTKDALLQASPEVQQYYLNSDGTLKDGFYFYNAARQEASDGQEVYVWYYETTEIPYHITFEDGREATYPVQDKELQRIFTYAEPQTASSDYVLYTLSRMGVGNVLLLIFIPYFAIVMILFITNLSVSPSAPGTGNRIRNILHNAGTLYAISFIIQTMVIVRGVFGVSLFSGLSLPLVASGNFEMFLNSICTAMLLFAAGDPNKAEEGGEAA